MLEPVQLTCPTAAELEALLAELTLEVLLADDEPYEELIIEA